MTAEAIARVIRDFRRGNVVNLSDRGRIEVGPAFRFQPAVELVATASVIDATVMYQDLLQSKGVDIYEDHTLRPPWTDAAVCYVNEHGNVVVMHCNTIATDELPIKHRWESLADTHTIDWDAVRWVTACRYWAGGRAGDGRTIPTCGPVFQTAWAIDADGNLLDLLWTAIARSEWDMATLVALRTITFLNCRNVIVREPARPRPEAKRVARLGITVNEVHIAPIGSWTRRPGAQPRPGSTVPLTTVRGHLARYGPEYERGLLFGKYAGIFWIPGHARGRREAGVSLHDYTIEEAPA